MSEQPTRRGPDNGKPPPPTRAQRLAAFGFLGAFGLTILTVLLTGLRVGAPAVRHVLQPVPPAVERAAPSTQPGASSATSSAGPSMPAAAPPSVNEQRKKEDAVREGSGRDPDNAPRKDSRGDTHDSRADDAP